VHVFRPFTVKVAVPLSCASVGGATGAAGPAADHIPFAEVPRRIAAESRLGEYHREHGYGHYHAKFCTGAGPGRRGHPRSMQRVERGVKGARRSASDDQTARHKMSYALARAILAANESLIVANIPLDASRACTSRRTGTGMQKGADRELLLARACGASVENAARMAGMSERTAYRRLEDPAFLEQLKLLQAEMVQRTAGMLTGSGIGGPTGPGAGAVVAGLGKGRVMRSVGRRWR
jgi:hypothetical protein